MKRSIKFKIFMAIGVIAFIFVGLFSLLNIFFYDDYYMFQKQHTLIDIYDKINRVYDGGAEAVLDTLQSMEYTYGVRITITGSDGQDIKYNTIFRGSRMDGELRAMLPPEWRRESSGRFTFDEGELAEKGYTFGKMEYPDMKIEFISLIGNLAGGDQLIVNIPVDYMEETSHFNMVFLLLAGLFTLFVCIIAAYFISKQFSRPLIEINDVATALATLDFDKKYMGKSKDEIGQLGESVNKLSAYLQKAIGELRETNKKLEEEVEKRHRIDEMRKEFIINVSHELKAPIAIIQGYSEGLKVNVSSSEEDKNYYCDIIIDEARRMNKLVMQLLSLSRIELGNLRPELCEIDLKSKVEQAVAKIRLLAEAKGVVIDMSGLKSTAWGDFDMMDQVLTNYLTNAIEHTPPGGKVRIFEEDRGERVRVSVFNEGEPIPEEELPKIWEKFYKIDKARTRTGGGTGIGLSIVKVIMEAHGNACGVINRENGVEFYFEMDQHASPG